MQIIERDTGDVNCILLRDKFAQALRNSVWKKLKKS